MLTGGQQHLILTAGLSKGGRLHARDSEARASRPECARALVLDKGTAHERSAKDS